MPAIEIQKNPELREIINYLNNEGIAYQINTRRRHLRLEYRVCGFTRHQTLARTPSDHRSMRNSLADLKRGVEAAKQQYQEMLAERQRSSENVPVKRPPVAATTESRQITPPQLMIEGDTAFVTSRQIADSFGKQHAHVLRDIDLLAEQTDSPKLDSLFRATTWPDKKGIHRRLFHITRDGFSLLAMGFTGKNALQWKLAYIDAFNRMEKIARERIPDSLLSDRMGALESEVRTLTDVLLEQKTALPQQAKGARFIRPSVLRRLNAASKETPIHR